MRREAREGAVGNGGEGEPVLGTIVREGEGDRLSSNRERTAFMTGYKGSASVTTLTVAVTPHSPLVLKSDSDELIDESVEEVASNSSDDVVLSKRKFFACDPRSQYDTNSSDPIRQPTLRRTFHLRSQGLGSRSGSTPPPSPSIRSCKSRSPKISLSRT
jgi:hypothetical protein